MKQFEDMAIKNWLQKVEDAAFILDDILDKCATQDLRREYQQQMHGWFNKVNNSCRLSLGLKKAVFQIRMANKMKRVRKTLESIAEERKMFHLCETFTPIEKKAELMDWRQTSSVITQPVVYGREEDKERIVQALTGTSSDVEEVSVYPIVGLGGLGKTTLAQLIFNDDRITEHFELKLWVCVSDDFSLKRMIKAIIESASRCAIEDLDLDPLQKRLQQTLYGKHYLLVLDDVWSEDQEKWDRLKYSLVACGSKGASILVTTRLTKVASIMETLPPHNLSFLSDEDCWSLFKQRAFGQDREESVELVGIGKEIVKKCKGLPLAAKALGSLLRFKREEREWQNIKDSEIWNLPQKENSILPALRLSYLNLQLKSRQCFSFCTIFSKGYKIEKVDLIHLWMANGFLSSVGKMMVEDVAEEIINELCWASFFQDIEEDDFGNVKHFKIHDLLHDLARSVMGDACSIVNDERSTKHPRRLRHLTITADCRCLRLCSLHQLESLRTFWDRTDYYCVVCSSRMLRSSKSLRALHLRGSGNCGKFRSSFTHFKHLRYINFASNYIRELPESISNLCNLQILNLNYCLKLMRLPNNLKCLKSLRHLLLKMCKSLSQMSQDIGQLTFLRTLNLYIVGSRKGFLLGELGQLCLKGELHIKNLERVRSVVDAREANLIGKQLDKLFLSRRRSSQLELQQNVEHILEALEPHPKLASLGVGGYEGSHFPHWMCRLDFNNLCYLRLIDCRYILQLPQLRKLPHLKHLEIHNMHDVQYVCDESYNGGAARGFPSLKYLLLSFMPNLERLSKEEAGDMFPCLSELDILACPKLSMPSLPSVRKLRLANSLNRVSVNPALASRQALAQHPHTSESEVQLGFVHNLNCLEILSIIDDQKLTSFSVRILGDLTCFRDLYIANQSKLEVLPTELFNTITLEKLYIVRCNSLQSLTEQELNGLHSLRTLVIERCDNFKGLSTGFQCLTSFKDLVIANCPKVVALSEDLQHIPPMLQSITLCGLPNLERLPDCWGSTRSLQSLLIISCYKLMSLPLGGGWFDNLKSLTIAVCPRLQERFERETGQDWQWIKHIPRINVGLSYSYSYWLPSNYELLLVNAGGIL